MITLVVLIPSTTVIASAITSAKPRSSPIRRSRFLMCRPLRPDAVSQVDGVLELVPADLCALDADRKVERQRRQASRGMRERREDVLGRQVVGDPRAGGGAANGPRLPKEP